MEVGVQSQFGDNLADLLVRVITHNEKRFKFAGGDDPSFHYVSIPGDDNSVFFQGNINQPAIIPVVEKEGIIAEHSQPFGEFTGIEVDDELRGDFGTHFSHPESNLQRDLHTLVRDSNRGI